MLPDFSRPAFRCVALCTVRFCAGDDGCERTVFSDYRCQICQRGGGNVAEARVFLVGQEYTVSGQGVPAIVAFLVADRFESWCRAGVEFELREAATVTADGIVESIAVRD